MIMSELFLHALETQSRRGIATVQAEAHLVVVHFDLGWQHQPRAQHQRASNWGPEYETYYDWSCERILFGSRRERVYGRGMGTFY